MKAAPDRVFRLSQSEAESQPDPAETAGTHSLKPLDKSAPIAKIQRTLPHWSQDGCTYFVTFRLADSVAAPVWKQWKEQRATWLATHPKPWDSETQKDFNTKFPAQMELWLDAGYGSCALRDPVLRGLIAKAIHHFDNHHFTLGDYVLMPNHVHVLVTPHPGHTLEAFLTGWKRVSGHAILHHSGGAKPFWMSEDFDHVVRSEKQLLHFKNYIAENPRKAGLRPGSWTHRVAT
jgi:putative transposase